MVLYSHESSIGRARSLAPCDGRTPELRKGSVRCTRKRDGQEACELVDMLISSRVQTFLGIPLRTAPIRRFGESDKVATFALCPDQTTHLPPKPYLSVLPHPAPPHLVRVDRGSPTSRRGPQSANRSSPVEASPSVRADPAFAVTLRSRPRARRPTAVSCFADRLRLPS
jgi:hypothetical protein